MFKLWTILEFEFEGSEDFSDDYLDDLAPDEDPDDEYNNYGAQALKDRNTAHCPGGKSRVKVAYWISYNIAIAIWNFSLLLPI